MAVAYFVRMVTKEGQADNLLDLCLVSLRCIEDGEQGSGTTYIGHNALHFL